ncbi:MAG: pyridoxine 5'-phosphate synthase [Bacteroidales bacterium]|jgi:pyridoxine 5-phosphate synthase|nr:pyridoxine 5'-phosphate synthase [Bacteroidales bacterium]
MKTKLSVNINKVATIRNARGGNIPDIVQVAMDCEKFGAQGITVHPRPDERHIRYSDVYALRPLLTTEFNIEGNPTSRFMQLVLDVKPHQATLVPDAADTLTSDSGWDVVAHRDLLTDVIKALKQAGIRTSVFTGTDVRMIEAAAAIGTDRVELYTGPYARLFPIDREASVAPFVQAAEAAKAAGLDVNAGHDLNLTNLKFFIKSIPCVKEVSIGHALISDALYFGLQQTIRLYGEQIAAADSDTP